MRMHRLPNAPLANGQPSEAAVGKAGKPALLVPQERNGGTSDTDGETHSFAQLRKVLFLLNLGGLSVGS